MIQSLSKQARSLLEKRLFAVLTTLNPDGSPHQTAMWYELVGDTIIMNTMIGRVKYHNMRRDPRISVCIEREYCFVTVSGTAEIIDDPVIAQNDIYRLARRYDGEESALRQMRERFSQEPRVTLRLTCEKVIEYFSGPC